GGMTVGNIVRRAFCSAHIGYWIDEAHAGRGIMPTSLALVCDHAFTTGALHRIEVNIQPHNTPSRRVVEKLGFREEAQFKSYLYINGEWRDHVGYGMTIEDVTQGGVLARWLRSRAQSALKDHFSGHNGPSFFDSRLIGDHRAVAERTLK
ncbi:MAG: GNAT family N-acetyltransferase, partial [Stackebrandtia sp.]